MKLSSLKGNKLIFLGLSLIQLLLLAAVGASITLGSGVLKSKSDESIQLKLESERLEKTREEYQLAKRDVDQYKYYGEIADSVIPKDKELDRVTKELVQISNELSMPINSITYPSSGLGSNAKGAAAAGTSTQTIPVDGIPGLLAVTANISFEKPTNYENALRFIDRLGDNRRKFQISNLSLSNSDKGVQLTLSINIFVKQ